jgi:thymidylate kinase
VILRVPPEVAVERVLRRSPEEDSEGVRARSQEVFDADWASIGAKVVDGSRSEFEVVSDVQKLIWKRL